MTKRFRFYQVFLAVLFILPHILAFGRSAWIYFALTIAIMVVWYAIKKREFRLAFRQIVVLSLLGIALVYAFVKLVPESDYLVSALEARISQGQDDLKFKEGTYGSRLASIGALITLWQNSNIFFGIGMHPLWVIKPLTVEENIYAWGFSDVGWASVLAAYGLVGFILALIYQIYYFVVSIKVVKNSKYNDILVFFALVFLSRLFFDSIINGAYVGLSVGLWGFWSTAIYVSAITYKLEYPNEEYNI
jgi:hypothetical protein